MSYVHRHNITIDANNIYSDPYIFIDIDNNWFTFFGIIIFLIKPIASATGGMITGFLFVGYVYFFSFFTHKITRQTTSYSQDTLKQLRSLTYMLLFQVLVIDKSIIFLV